MNNSKSNGNGKGEFFGAISKNCKTVMVENSKRAIRREIERRHIAKNNVIIFKCHLTKKNMITKKPIHNPRFKLNHYHHAVLTNACLNFLAQNKIS